MASAPVQSCGRLHLQNANLTRVSVHTAGMQMSLLNDCLANKAHIWNVRLKKKIYILILFM